MHFFRLLSAAAFSTPLAVMAEPPVFTQSAIGGNLVNAFDVVAGDFNGDLLVDIVVTLPSINDIVLLQNPGGDFTGEWTRTTIENNALGCSGVEAGDIDGDGDLDVISANKNIGRVALYLNPQIGANTDWVERVIDTNADDVLFVELGDFDSDGNLDVVAGVSGEDEVIWYQNPGADELESVSSWEDFRIDLAADSVSGIQVADIDNDGDPDVIANAGGDSDVIWYQNPGGDDPMGNWKATEIDGSNTGNFYSIVGDFDEDGAVDVAVVSTNQDTVTIYFNSLAKPGEEWVKVLVGDDASILNGVSRIDAADFDSDGDLDLIVSATQNDDVVYLENPGPSGARMADSWTPQSISDDSDLDAPFGLAVADFDGNGSSDFAVALGNDDEVRLFLNQAVVMPLVAPVISSIVAANEGGFNITFDAVDGVNYKLQVSDDLTEFTDVDGVTVDSSGVVPIPSGEERMFYRIVAER